MASHHNKWQCRLDGGASDAIPAQKSGRAPSVFALALLVGDDPAMIGPAIPLRSPSVSGGVEANAYNSQLARKWLDETNVFDVSDVFYLMSMATTTNHAFL